jgi:hypothetical protein
MPLRINSDEPQARGKVKTMSSAARKKKDGQETREKIEPHGSPPFPVRLAEVAPEVVELLCPGAFSKSERGGQGAEGPAGMPAATPCPDRNPSTRDTPVGFETVWPLGLRANLADRRVWRNGAEADLAGNKGAWEALVMLTRNHPARTHVTALWRNETEQGAVYMIVSRLRQLLRPLGLDISTTRNAGYLLAERS